MDMDQYQGYHETKVHTSEDFPYNTLPCTIPLDFTSVPLHWHNTAEIIVVKKGSGIIGLDMTDLVCREGDFVLVLPGHLHSIRPLKNENGFVRMEYENIIFSTSLLLARQPEMTSSLIETFLQGDYLPEVLHFTRKERWHDNARLIIEETDLLCSQKPEGYQIAVRGNLLRLFYLIVSRTVRTPGKLRPGRLEKVKRIVKYVEDHFAEPISIHDMAKLSGYSESHFMKFFRDTMGMSFISWLERYRLSMAARMLTLTDDPILLVSANAGYPNLSYFNRSFKARYGMTPSSYRRQSAASH